MKKTIFYILLIVWYYFVFGQDKLNLAGEWEVKLDPDIIWPKQYKSPLQPIDTWKINRKLALLVETKVGMGKLVICSIDIETDLDNRPVTKLLRNNLLDYMSSKVFNPQKEIDIASVKEIFDFQNQNK
jgi:hypothetical protein